jgi:hypothetical protein
MAPYEMQFLSKDKICRAGAGLKSVGSGITLRARAFAGWAEPGLGGRLGVWPAGLAQKPGPRGLGPGPAPTLKICIVRTNHGFSVC